MWGWTNRAERRLQQRRVMREGAWEGEGHREERQRWRERGRDGEREAEMERTEGDRDGVTVQVGTPVFTANGDGVKCDG